MLHFRLGRRDVVDDIQTGEEFVEVTEGAGLCYKHEPRNLMRRGKESDT